MNTLVDNIANTSAVDVWFGENKLYIRLVNGRELGGPITWFPRLRNASEKDKNQLRFIDIGTGIYGEAIDEDLSVAGLLRTG